MSFIKTTWFKCIACLLSIAVISGASLSILNNVLAVSPEMRTARAIKKIYGEEKEYSVVLDIDSNDDTKNAPIEYDGVGKINKIYNITDNGDILFQTTGYKGYKNGTITLWIQVSVYYAEPYGNPQDDDFGCEGYSIEKIVLQSTEKQTLMSKLTGEFYGGFKLTDVTEAYNNGELFTATEKTAENYNPVSGATYSATAAANAVNCVIKYLGGER
ncbi:MAG: hypothetical protein IJQ87_02845 [Clostridia bacterium]|nr:hypothetical protein [Clostridia bacterium]